MRGGLIIGLLAASLGCQNKTESLGTMRLGAKADPRFDQAWRALAARGDDEADVFYIEDDRGEGMMARVRRGPKSVPTSSPPSTAPPPAAGEPDQPSGDSVSATIRSNLPGIKACYLRLTRQGKSLAGRAILSFTVAKDGRAGNVKVDSPVFAESELPRCMSLQVASWSFPRSKRGGFEVSYPFVFVGE
jgi:hypothetical protein